MALRRCHQFMASRTTRMIKPTQHNVPNIPEKILLNPPELPTPSELSSERIAARVAPVVKSRAATVDRFDDALRDQVERMASLMHDALGIGLAAPQIGISQRLLVYRVGPDGPVHALVNPELEWESRDTEAFEEGCLSIPGILVDVHRPIHVRIRARDEFGDDRVVEASGLEARVIQHEVDHLNGVLILDRTSKDERRDAIRQIREAEREAA